MSDPRRIPITPEERQAAKSAELQKRLAKIEKTGAPTSAVTLPAHKSSHSTGGTDALAAADIGALGASDPRILTTDMRAAAVGTDGLPSGSNPYVTDSDPRVSSAPNLVRQTLSQTITVAAGAEVSVNLTLSTAFTIWQVQTDKPARVRIYATTGARTTDQSRSTTTAPTAGIGLITEIITTAGLLIVPCCPPQSGASLATTPTATIPALIKNDGTTGDVVLNLTWTAAEA